MENKVTYLSEWTRVLGSKPPQLFAAQLCELQQDIKDSRCSLQMLAIHDSLRLRDQFGKDDHVWMPPDWVPLWDDAESNFIGIHYRGVLTGWIAVMDHDGDFDTTPLFRSVQSFRRALKDPSAFDWRALVFDYPQHGEFRTVARTDMEKREDKSLASQLLDGIDSMIDPCHRRWAFLTVMALLSEQDDRQFVSFLAHSDPAIRCRACRLIGFHRIQSQLPTLISLTKTDEETRADALYSIGQIGASTSPQVLLELLALFPERRHQFAHAFELCGLTPKSTAGEWEVQIPNGAVVRF